MNIRNIIVSTILFSFPMSMLTLNISTVNSFAICDKERAERDKFQDLVNGAATGSSVCGLLGMGLGFLFAGPVGLAIGGVAGAIPAPAGSNWNRILREKENNLRNCEESHLRAEKLAEIREIENQASVLRIHREFDERKGQIKEQFQSRSNALLAELQSADIDLLSPEIQEELRERTDELQQELDHALDLLEEERQQTLSEARK